MRSEVAFNAPCGLSQRPERRLLDALLSNQEFVLADSVSAVFHRWIYVPNYYVASRYLLEVVDGALEAKNSCVVLIDIVPTNALHMLLKNMMWDVGTYHSIKHTSCFKRVFVEVIITCDDNYYCFPIDFTKPAYGVVILMIQSLI